MENKPIFYTILTLEILIVILTGTGIIEREAVLIMTGLLIFYFIFSEIKDSLILFIVSIPLFVAMPITSSFDTMSNWRMLLVILFLKWFFENKIWTKKDFLKKFDIKKYSKLTIAITLFLIIALFSLTQTVDIVAGIKKMIFLVNIFLLFIVLKEIFLKQDKKYKLKIIKASAGAGVLSLIFGYTQLISVFFTSLYGFWQWWAKNVISAFYGINLSKLLTVSNTWFSYYEESPPTLRMFSIFPDSHSFALFIIIGLSVFSYLLISKNYNKKFGASIIWFIIGLSFLALLFSGSRGVWLSAIIPFIVIIFLFFSEKWKKITEYSKTYTKPLLIMLIIFILAFPISSFIVSVSQESKNGTLAFKRAKSIADLEELSVKSRLEIWKSSFESFIKKPILGVGIGNYPVVLNKEISAAKKGASAHNLYLDILSEMGLLGLMAALLIFWQIFKKLLKNKNHFSYIFIFFFAWILIYNLFDVVLLNDKVLLFFMVPLALIYSNE